MAENCDVIYVTLVALETSNTAWFRSIERTKEAYFMYQISYQSNELCRK